MAAGPDRVAEMKKAMEQLKTKFQSVDADGSGKMSFKELKEMVKGQNLCEDELQATFDSIDIDANGWISVTEFSEAMFKSSIRYNLESDFKSSDPHGKGTLSIAEATKIAKEYGCFLSDDELEAAFTLADRDGDGVITYKKFIRVLTL